MERIGSGQQEIGRADDQPRRVESTSGTGAGRMAKCHEEQDEQGQRVERVDDENRRKGDWIVAKWVKELGAI